MFCIIGAGIAGLTLAQYLKKQKIPFIVLDNRDDTWNGYSLTLMKAVDILKELDLFNDLQNIIITNKSYGFSYEGNPLWSRSVKKSKVIVQRGELLRVLRKDIPIISFNYDHYELTNDGVIIYDIDNNSLLCDYLIGCDGVRSKVRSQLIGPNYIESIQNLIIINGITESTKLLDGSYQFVDGVSRLFVKPFDQTHVMTQLSFPSSLCYKNLLQLCPKNLAKLIVNGWHDLPYELINKGTHITYRNLFQTKEISSLPAGRVTLMGDAAHTMSPFKGLGANTAMQDAQDFANIVSASKNKVDSIQVYNDIMLKRGNLNRLNSSINTKFSHSKEVLDQDKF